MIDRDSPILVQFPLAAACRQEGGAYLASNTMGLIPTSAADAELDAVRAQQRQGIAVWDPGGPWMAVLDRYAEVIGRLLDVPASWVCPITNITDGLWRVFSTVDPTSKRRAILTTSMAFTTQEYAGHGFRRLGAEVITVASDPAHHRVPLEALIHAIKTEQPAIVHLSHAAFESAFLHDAAAVGQACREVGATFCLDAAQTAFVLPFTLAEVNADVVLVQQHKWGCGGTGAAALVATAEWTTQHEPALVGWMSHKHTFSFKRGPATLAENAWRFCGGTPDVPSKARGARAAEILVDDVGVANIRAHNQALVSRLISGLKALGMDPIDQPQRTGFVAVQCASEARAQAIEHGLRARNIYIDGRGARLRIGPHFYNNAGDIDACLEALKALGG